MAPPLDWDLEEDEWAATGWSRGVNHVRAPPYPRGSGSLLAPEIGNFASSHRRSRSQGQAPAPNVYVYQGQRNESRSPDRRRSRHETEEVVDGLDHIAREIRRGRSREPAFRDQSPGYYNAMQMELARERDWERREWDKDAREREAHSAQLARDRIEIQRLEDRLYDAEKDKRYRTDEERYRKELELERMREEMKRRNEELRLQEEREKYYIEREKEERKKREERAAILAAKEREEEEAKEKEKKMKLEWAEREKLEKLKKERLLMDYNEEQRKKKEDEQKAKEALLAEHDADVAKKKKERERLAAELKAEEEAKKAKDKAEKEAWIAKLKAEEEAKKAEAKKKEDELEEAMRKRLSRFGLQNNQIEAIIDPKKAQPLRPGQSPNNALVPFATQSQTFIKIHRDHIDVETLRYYGLRYEVDSVDPSYVVILQELSTRETDILFEHTRKLRRGGTELLIEERGRHTEHPEYAFVRRRKPSASPHGHRRSSSKTVSFFASTRH
jgi:hypothetical protein